MVCPTGAQTVASTDNPTTTSDTPAPSSKDASKEYRSLDSDATWDITAGPMAAVPSFLCPLNSALTLSSSSLLTNGPDEGPQLISDPPTASLYNNIPIVAPPVRSPQTASSLKRICPPSSSMKCPPGSSQHSIAMASQMGVRSFGFPQHASSPLLNQTAGAASLNRLTVSSAWRHPHHYSVRPVPSQHHTLAPGANAAANRSFVVSSRFEAPISLNRDLGRRCASQAAARGDRSDLRLHGASPNGGNRAVIYEHGNLSQQQTFVEERYRSTSVNRNSAFFPVRAATAVNHYSARSPLQGTLSSSVPPRQTTGSAFTTYSNTYAVPHQSQHYQPSLYYQIHSSARRAPGSSFSRIVANPHVKAFVPTRSSGGPTGVFQMYRGLNEQPRSSAFGSTADSKLAKERASDEQQMSAPGDNANGCRINTNQSPVAIPPADAAPHYNTPDVRLADFLRSVGLK